MLCRLARRQLQAPYGLDLCLPRHHLQLEKPEELGGLPGFRSGFMAAISRSGASKFPFGDSTPAPKWDQL
jgi:hypothetical protein